MSRCKKFFILTIIAVTAIALVTACGGKPIDYHPIDEIPKGPGILTEETDGAVLYDSKGKGYLQSIGKASPSKVDHSADRATAPTSSNPTSEPHQDSADYQEYEAYRQWKEWREKAKSSTEYQEFIEWREWKSYQEWKKQQPKKQ